jgi:DNA-binding HxlR family transcriptional regulator
MTKREYGQYCGVTRALEMVGERWGLLIVRDLLVGPRRYSDLKRGLPKIPTNILATRLKEMEDAGVIERQILPRPSSGVAYVLTPYGRELEAAVLALGRWGAQSLGPLRNGEVVTSDSLTMALRTTFQPAAAAHLRVTWNVIFGDIRLHVVIRDGDILVEPETVSDADATFDFHGPVNLLMAGEITPEQFINGDMVRMIGDPSALDVFADVFRIGPADDLAATG